MSPAANAIRYDGIGISKLLELVFLPLEICVLECIAAATAVKV